LSLETARWVLVTALDVVGRQEVLRRLDAVSALAADARARFAVQLRDPQLGGRALCAWGHELRERTRAIGAALIVNDRVDLFLALGADGLHLGRGSIRVADARRLAGRAWIARSAHDLDEARAAARDGADAVVLSPIFESPGKGPALGLAAVTEARAALPAGTGLVCLGGIDRERARACVAAGADAVASIRADISDLLLEKAASRSARDYDGS
jgi:thiamine-phosphate pyrophosphorylase